MFGFGVLGRQVASAFAADGFPVNAYSRSTTTAESNVRVFSAAGVVDQFAEFMRETRVLAILAPLTSETQDKFDLETLQMLPAGAYVINIARGEIVNESALIEALRARRLAGAYLDVFGQEPLPQDSPLWDLPNVLLTPHNSSAAAGNDGRIFEIFLENLGRIARNESLLNQAGK